MSLFRKFADFCKKSNDIYIDKWSKEQNVKISIRENEERREKSTNSCANCIYFREAAYGKCYYCLKHDFCFDFDEAKYNKVHYKKSCGDFHRK